MNSQITSFKDLLIAYEDFHRSHKKLWNWIADETKRRQRIIEKEQYFNEFREEHRPINDCYACEFSRQLMIFYSTYMTKIKVIDPDVRCSLCPLKWTPGRIDMTCLTGYNNLYRSWCNAAYEQNICNAIRYARELANAELNYDHLSIVGLTKEVISQINEKRDINEF